MKRGKGEKQRRAAGDLAGDDRNTPEEVLAPVREFFDGVIGLDPFSNRWSTVRAAVELRKESHPNAWTANWYELAAGGGCFVNGPWSVGMLGRVFERCVRWASAGLEVVTLSPDDATTEWYRLAWNNAHAVCRWGDRIVYPLHGVAKDPELRASALFLFTPYASRERRFRELFTRKGITHGLPARKLLRAA